MQSANTRSEAVHATGDHQRLFGLGTYVSSCGTGTTKLYRVLSLFHRVLRVTLHRDHHLQLWCVETQRGSSTLQVDNFSLSVLSNTLSFLSSLRSDEKYFDVQYVVFERENFNRITNTTRSNTGTWRPKKLKISYREENQHDLPPVRNSFDSWIFTCTHTHIHTNISHKQQVPHITNPDWATIWLTNNSGDDNSEPQISAFTERLMKYVHLEDPMW